MTRGKSLVEELLADRIARGGSRQTVMILDASVVLAFSMTNPALTSVADAATGRADIGGKISRGALEVGDWGGDIVGIEERLGPLACRLLPAQCDDAVVVAALRQLDGGTALSLGDCVVLTSVCGTARQQRSPPTAPGRPPGLYRYHRTDPMSCLVGNRRPYEGKLA